MEEQLAELKWQRELGSGWGGRNGAEQKVHYMCMHMCMHMHM